MMLYIGIYIAGAVAFMLWDSLIGFGYEFDDNIFEGPTAWLAAMFWPIAFPISLLAFLNKSLSSFKEKRLERAEKKRARIAQLKRIRVEQEQEERAVLQQIDRELEDVKKQSSHLS